MASSAPDSAVQPANQPAQPAASLASTSGPDGQDLMDSKRIELYDTTIPLLAPGIVQVMSSLSDTCEFPAWVSRKTDSSKLLREATGRAFLAALKDDNVAKFLSECDALARCSLIPKTNLKR